MFKTQISRELAAEFGEYRTPGHVIGGTVGLAVDETVSRPPDHHEPHFYVSFLKV
jgi:hypothetical protein